ncbi:MAG: metallophosphoesterase [Gemmatimonadaceae bacterium]
MGSLSEVDGICLIACAVLVFGCSRGEKPKPTPRASLPSDQVDSILPGATVLVSAGDIAVCGKTGDEGTAALVERILTSDSAHNVPTVVATLGDNAYPSGSSGVDGDYPRCFSPSWGSARIMRVLHPSPGNHDYDSGNLDAYSRYFARSAGPSGNGYYSYDVGSWHVVALNSELYFYDLRPGVARAQEDWLRNDLKDHPTLCTLAYFHRPLFSSGVYSPGTKEMHALWDILDKGNVDVVLNGHEHHYERFLPQTPQGVADSTRGITEIIAGTGGGELRAIHKPVTANSVTQIRGRFGVLKMSLGAGAYTHAFIDTDGGVWDAGSGKCH